MATIRVEVVYAMPEGEDAVKLSLPSGATAADAVRASGILARHPGMRLQKIGIFGRAVAGSTALVDGDRVEIYRSLALDPKEARRRRAATKR